MSDKSRPSGKDALYLGELELLVLLAVLRLGADAYGVTVAQILYEQTGREFRLGTIYKTLSRLEDKRYVTSREGEPSAERGGRRKRLYRVEPLGASAVRQALERVRRLSRGIARELEAL